MIERCRRFISEDFGLAPAEVDSIMRRVYNRGHRLMLCFVTAHALLALYQARFYGTWVPTVAVIVVGVGGYLASLVLGPETRLARIAGGITLQGFVALFIYQLHGLPEMHFYHFTTQTMLVIYEDWLVGWPSALLTIMGEYVLAVLNTGRAELHSFPDTYVTFQKLHLHFGILLVQTTDRKSVV